MPQSDERSFDAMIPKIVVALVIAGIIGGLGLITRVEVLATRVEVLEVERAARDGDRGRLERIEAELRELGRRFDRLDDRLERQRSGGPP